LPAVGRTSIPRPILLLLLLLLTAIPRPILLLLLLLLLTAIPRPIRVRVSANREDLAF
jgi:hypothetical protein